MPDLDETVRQALRSPDAATGARAATPPDALWRDVQRRIRRHRRRRRALVGAAAVALLATGGLAVALAAGDGDGGRVVDAGPGPSTTEARPPGATTTSAPPPGDPAVEQAWQDLPDGPIRREGFSATWTGDLLLVWGGTADDGTFPGDQPEGAVYDPAAGSWRAMAESPLTPRRDHVAVWTGDELLVWGGRVLNGAPGAAPTYALDGGAAYDPATDTWRMLPPAPLPADAYEGVWTGDELVLMGGGEAVVAGAAYDPAAGEWRAITPPPVAVVHPRLAWTGEEVLVTGGFHTGDGPAEQFFVAPWDPATDTWREQGGGSPMGSQPVEATWTGRELVVWGHSPAEEGTWVLDDPRGNWRQVEGFPAACEAGIQSVAAGGTVVGLACGVIAAFDPGEGSWTELPAPGSAAAKVLVAAGSTVYALGEDGSLATLTL